MASSAATPAIRISPIRSRWRRSSPTSSSTTPRSPQRCCTTPSRIPRRRAPKSTACSAPTSAAGRGPHQTQAARPRLQGGQAGRKPAQAVAGHRRRRARAAGQARRPPAQHADAALHAARSRRRTAEETLEIYAPLAGRMGMHEMREELEDLSFRELNPDAYKVVSERLEALADAQQAPGFPRSSSSSPRNSRDRGITAKVPGRRKRAYSIWRKMERKAVGFEQLSDIFGFRVVVDTTANATRRSASCTPPGRSCRAASRITCRRRSRTTTARSTPR